jgi:hypothetical protein
MTRDYEAEAFALCRGSYQRGIVSGRQRISGSDLKGSARHWGAAYHASRRAILARLTAAGIPHHVEVYRERHGLHVLVIGS